jgi:hypothetical protein
VNKEENKKIFKNIHSKSIRNAIWSNYETEIASISFDQTCSISDSETGKSLILNSLTKNSLILRRK